MPMVHLTHVKGSLDDAQKQELSERLTKELLVIEGGADTPAGRSIAWVLFNEVEPQTWAVGGRFDNAYVAKAGKFLATVTVPEGSMNQARKSAVHKAVNDAIVDVVGAKGVADAGRSAWVIINEVTEGHWGAGGQTVSIAHIFAMAGAGAELFAFVKRYFNAKRRVFQFGGYPDDAAGLMRAPTGELV